MPCSFQAPVYITDRLTRPLKLPTFLHDLHCLSVSVNGDLVVQQRRRRISDVVLSELQQPRQEEQTQTELKTAVLHFNF